MTRDLHLEALTLAVQLSVGSPDAMPRPGQLAVSRQISAAMDTDGQVAGACPTGSGKSLAYLTPAVLRAAQADERTVVSTESLALQEQIDTKDAPAVVEAVRRLTGREIKVAVYKGWSNHACAVEATKALQALLDRAEDDPPASKDGLLALADRAELHTAGTPASARITASNGLVPARELLEAAAWGVRASATAGRADRHSFPGAVTDQVWGAITVSAADCLKANCPLRDFCRPFAAKLNAAQASVVVTNHTMLGIQAARAIPVVLSSASLGQFHHVVVDEAHALPEAVRSQGESRVSGRQLVLLKNAVARGIDTWKAGHLPPAGKGPGSDASRSVVGAWKQAMIAVRIAEIGQEADGYHRVLAKGVDVANLLDSALQATAGRVGSGANPGNSMNRLPMSGNLVKLSAADLPLGDADSAVLAWTSEIARIVNSLAFAIGAELTAARTQKTLLNRINGLRESVRTTARHEIGTARWLELETDRNGASEWVAKSSPVAVWNLLKAQVWATEVITDGKDERDFDTMIAESGANGKQKVPMSVSLVSATLPFGFAREVGVSCKVTEHPSPLLEAFARSAIHVPRPVESELGRLMRGGRTLDTAAHADWATRRIIELVDANGGSALVLAATAKNGRRYAEELLLAARGRWNVLSQWDGLLAFAVAAQWRQDIPSVLVGTKSCMTGLDAKGPTNTLVILDRIPRAPGNPLGDARVEVLTADGQARWDADRRVYGADAAVLAHQAIGRLLRTESDSGMAVLLDPRLLKGHPFSYNTQTQKLYAGRRTRISGSRFHPPREHWPG